MKKITELQDRSKLSEGRSWGIGFTILNKIEDVYETFLPFTACRDYLNDFTYVESTKKEIGSIHGYKHKLLDCFENQQYFYIGVKTVHYNAGKNWDLFPQCEKILKSNYKVLEQLLNNLESEIGLEDKTSIELDEETLIIKAPIFWSKSTALISAYTLLIRCLFNIPEADLKQDFINIINNNKCFIKDDNYFKDSLTSFYKEILKDKERFENIDYSKLGINDTSDIHDFGVQGFLNSLKWVK